MELERRVEAFVQKHTLFSPGASIVVACSGGPDSLALLTILSALRKRWRLTLGVAHFEHGIRGAASREDAEFVRTFASEIGLPCRVAHEDVPLHAKRAHVSLETAARERRYAFLFGVAQEMGEGTLIATAHHAGDQAETVLMRILRGSGLTGLAGMRPRTGNLIRPLLSVSRTEIEDYCKAKELSPRVDETNAEPIAMRNRIRLELLPMLRRYNPSIDDALCRLATAAAEQVDYFAPMAEAACQDIIKEEKGVLLIRRKLYRDMPPALRHEILKCLVERIGIYSRFGISHYDELDSLCRFGETGKRHELFEGIVAECRYGEVAILRNKSSDEVWPEVPLAIPGETRIDAIGLTVFAEPCDAMPVDIDARSAVLDADALRSPCVVRMRRAGDVIRLEDGKRQKLKELLIDRKVLRSMRNRVPIFAADGEIFWVGGVRRASVAMVTEATERFVQLRLVWDEDSGFDVGQSS